MTGKDLWIAHLQYNYKGYGTDTFGKGAQNVVTPPTSNDNVGVAYINGSNVNLRKGYGTGYGVIRQLGKGESYKVFGQTNGWLNLGGDQWVYNDPSYIRYTGGNVPATSQSSNDGVGVVTIIADVLRVRTGPGTNYGIVKTCTKVKNINRLDIKMVGIMLVEINGFLVNMLRL